MVGETTCWVFLRVPYCTLFVGTVSTSYLLAGVMSANFFVPFLIEVEGILVTFVTCNYCGEYQKLLQTY